MIDTKLNRRQAMQLGAAAGLTHLPGRRRAAAQGTTITFWNSTFPTVDPNDKGKKLEDFYVYKAVSRFQEANPGITVAIENIQDGPDQFTKYRTSSVAKNGPDVMGIWSGS